MANGITIQKKSVMESDGVVLLPVREYRRLIVQSVPTYYLTGKAAEEVDALVREGLKEQREGKTRKIKSLADLD